MLIVQCLKLQLFQELWELKLQLESLGQEVLIPGFPVDSWEDLTDAGPSYLMKKQNLLNWLNTARKFVPGLQGEKLCFIGHSLGCVFILHLLSKYKIKIDSAIFVSPFLDDLKSLWQFKIANNTFYKTDFNFLKLKKFLPVSYVLYSDSDPYVDKNRSILFGKALESSLINVKKAGHMNSEVNLNEFPLVLELCKTRIDLTLYQRYLIHKADSDAIDLLRKHREGVLIIPPEDVDDEGLFHFRNLQKSGFATWNIDIKDFWIKTRHYFENARIAARRVKDFIRILIIRSRKDLQDKKIQEFIKKDLAAGIEIYYCFFNNAEKIIPELDFGIWDEEYVCIVKNSQNNVKEIELNSKSDAISRAKDWKKAILAISKKYKK